MARDMLVVLLALCLSWAPAAAGEGGGDLGYQVLNVTKYGNLTVQAVRSQLDLGSDDAFARLERGGACVRPLSDYQESLVVVDEKIVLLTGGDSGSHSALLRAYRHPPANALLWNMVRPDPIGAAADVVSPRFCEGWVNQVRLLAQLWEKRTYGLEEGSSDDDLAASRIAEALAYFGWLPAETTGEALVPLTRETRSKAWRGSQARPGEVPAGRLSLVNRPPPVVTDRAHLLASLQLKSEALDLAKGKCLSFNPNDVIPATKSAVAPLLVNGKRSVLRTYVLFASFDPLVVFGNFQNGHVELLGAEGDPDAVNETWTFGQLDEYMLKEHGLEHFFSTYVHQQYKNRVATVVESVAHEFSGAAGHFHLACADFALSNFVDTKVPPRLFLQEMHSESECGAMAGFNDTIKQRQFIMQHAMNTVLKVQKAVLSDRPVFGALNAKFETPNGFYELIHSNQKGASYKIGARRCKDSVDATESDIASYRSYKAEKERAAALAAERGKAASHEMSGSGLATRIKAAWASLKGMLPTDTDQAQDKAHHHHETGLKDLIVRMTKVDGEFWPKLMIKTTPITYTSSTAGSGSVTLSDLRGQLGLNAGTFVKISEDGSCITPLSRFQEQTALLGEDIGLMSSALDKQNRALLDLFLDPPDHATVWSPVRPPAVGDMKDFPPLFCQDWLRQVFLLSRLWEKRAFFFRTIKWEEWYFEHRMIETLGYYGWAKVDSKGEALVALLHEFEPWGNPGDMDETSVMQIGHYLVNRPPPAFTGNKKKLFDHLSAVSESPNNCFTLAHVHPETWSADNPEHCNIIKRRLAEKDGTKWLRKVGNVHIGFGIEPVTELSPYDCDPSISWDERLPNGRLKREKNVLYQQLVDTLKIDGRVTSLRLYAMFASFDPLVVFGNFQNGHLYISGDDRKWYAQNQSETWNMAQLDAYMLKEHGIGDFFASRIFPQYKEILAWSIQSALFKRNPFQGGVGHYDLVCLDLILSEGDYHLYVLEMNSDCHMTGGGAYSRDDAGGDSVPQRKYIWNSVMETVLDVQKQVLSDQSVLDLLDEDLKTSDEIYQLFYSNQEGAEVAPALDCAFFQESSQQHQGAPPPMENAAEEKEGEGKSEL